MFIAKMHTNYPEFHGIGYYNFLMDEDIEELEAKVEENSHDFRLIRIEEVELKSVEDILKKYPTKIELNKGVFSNE